MNLHTSHQMCDQTNPMASNGIRKLKGKPCTYVIRTLACSMLIMIAVE